MTPNCCVHRSCLSSLTPLLIIIVIIVATLLISVVSAPAFAVPVVLPAKICECDSASCRLSLFDGKSACGRYTPGSLNDCRDCVPGYVCGGFTAYLAPKGGFGRGKECCCKKNGPCRAPDWVVSTTKSNFGDCWGLACPAGSYQDEEGQSTCKPCALGSASSSKGLTTPCPSCAAGTIASDTGLSSCSRCAPGTYQDKEAQTACEPCAAGTASNETGRATPCPACEPGGLSGAGATSCSPCTVGEEANADRTACAKCAAGHFNSEAGQPCQPCPAGSESTDGRTSCVKCGPGHYNGQPGGSCRKCPGATAFAGSGATSLAQCAPCSPGPGYWAAPGSAYCLGCASGTHSPRVGTSEDSCVLCPGGTYANKPVGADSCVAAAPGYYAVAGSIEQRMCGPGTYSPGNADKCSLCLPGFFNDRSGGTSSEQFCRPCVLKSVAPNAGTPLCTHCPRDEVPNQQRTQCVPTNNTMSYSETLTIVDTATRSVPPTRTATSTKSPPPTRTRTQRLTGTAELSETAGTLSFSAGSPSVSDSYPTQRISRSTRSETGETATVHHTRSSRSVSETEPSLSAGTGSAEITAATNSSSFSDPSPSIPSMSLSQVDTRSAPPTKSAPESQSRNRDSVTPARTGNTDEPSNTSSRSVHEVTASHTPSIMPPAEEKPPGLSEAARQAIEIANDVNVAIVGALAGPTAMSVMRSTAVLALIGCPKRRKGEQDVKFPASLVPGAGFGVVDGYYNRMSIVAFIAMAVVIMAAGFLSSETIGRYNNQSTAREEGQDDEKEKATDGDNDDGKRRRQQQQRRQSTSQDALVEGGSFVQVRDPSNAEEMSAFASPSAVAAAANGDQNHDNDDDDDLLGIRQHKRRLQLQQQQQQQQREKKGKFHSDSNNNNNNTNNTSDNNSNNNSSGKLESPVDAAAAAAKAKGEKPVKSNRLLRWFLTYTSMMLGLWAPQAGRVIATYRVDDIFLALIPILFPFVVLSVVSYRLHRSIHYEWRGVMYTDSFVLEKKKSSVASRSGSIKSFLQSATGRWLFIGNHFWSRPKGPSGMPAQRLISQLANHLQKLRGPISVSSNFLSAENPFDTDEGDALFERINQQPARLVDWNTADGEVNIERTEQGESDFAARYLTYNWLLIAWTFGLTAGFFQGVAIARPEQCRILTKAICAVNCVSCALTIWARPFTVPLRNVAIIIIEVTGMITSLLCVIFISGSDEENRKYGELAEAIQIATTVIGFTVAAVMAVVAVVRQLCFFFGKCHLASQEEVWSAQENRFHTLEQTAEAEVDTHNTLLQLSPTIKRQAEEETKQRAHHERHRAKKRQPAIVISGAASPAAAAIHPAAATAAATAPKKKSSRSDPSAGAVGGPVAAPRPSQSNHHRHHHQQASASAAGGKRRRFSGLIDASLL